MVNADVPTLEEIESYIADIIHNIDVALPAPNVSWVDDEPTPHHGVLARYDVTFVVDGRACGFTVDFRRCDTIDDSLFLDTLAVKLAELAPQERR
ncbi:hypothetical protein [Halosegnis longus]|uniref:hypothetical protein n=1 Tax=Halosegnis longus TaxID=2216012 RepID=UPI00129E19F6|nr:hypothetical protein [Halosegnis longus]